MTLGRRDFNWFWVIAGLWAVIFFLVFAPASWWFEVRSVRVFDAPYGASPPMLVQRSINRAFHADWTVTVMRRGARGFHAHCTATGSNDYVPDAVLPDALDLDWWTWPTRCTLPVGSYRVKTLWVIHLPVFPDKEVRATSNVFQVR